MLNRTNRSRARVVAIAATGLLTVMAAGCGSDADLTATEPTPVTAAVPAPTAVDSTASAEPTSDETTTVEPTAAADPGVPGGNVRPDNPDDPNPEDPPGTGTIPARMTVDGGELEANACEVPGGAVRVRAGDGVTDTGVVVMGAANAPSMTLLTLTGGVNADDVEFSAVADDADEYSGTFDPEQTDGIETIVVEFNIGVLPCPDLE